MSRIASRRPSSDEYESPYHAQLIELVQGECALRVLDSQMFWLGQLADHVSVEQVDKIHPPYGWTIRQVYEHCAAAERVMGYRMLRIAAGDPTELPGFDQDAYADARYGLGNFGNLVSELELLRKSNLLLLRRIVPRAWDRSGIVDGVRVSVRALAWITAGHLHHHLAIVERRCELKVSRTRPSLTM